MMGGVCAMSELRDQIARVVVRRLSDDFPTWGESLILADALIRELGLKRASRPSDYGHVNYPQGYQYITDWITDD